MNIAQIILIVCGIISLISLIVCLIVAIQEWRDGKSFSWWFPILGLFIIPIGVLLALMKVLSFLLDNYQDGGIVLHYQREKRRKKEEEQRKVDNERIKNAYITGEIARDDLPRMTDGNKTFEFDESMGLYNNYWEYVRDIVYVENGYCKSLNSFFLRNKELPHYNNYRLLYLPNLCTDVSLSELSHYQHPDLVQDKIEQTIDSAYPIGYLWHPEETENIKHGLMFFYGLEDNHGAKYIKGHYYPLEEGGDDFVLQQLDDIVHKIHEEHNNAFLPMVEKKPDTAEGSTDEYADELFQWVVKDNEVAILVQEIRDKVAALKEMGIAEQVLLKLIQEKPRLSQLVVSKDMRIILPDYQMMEIKMEPINKAVYLLFLRHPEGIIFKHLPDYRRELAEIYQMIKPFGLTDRAIRSIEDVTNPCLNSINEKCARIRGAFISQFDESLAKHYYIYGERGEAKKISLSRDLVCWE